VRAEDREDLAALDPQVDAVHGALGAVALAQAADVHGRSAGPGTGAAGAGGRVCRRHATSVPRRARRPRRPFVRTSRPPIGGRWFDQGPLVAYSNPSVVDARHAGPRP